MKSHQIHGLFWFHIFTKSWPYYWIWPFYRIPRGLFYSFETDVACRQLMHTAHDTWHPLTSYLLMLFLLRTVFWVFWTLKTSVFIMEATSDIPYLGTSTIPTAPDFSVTEKGILKLLQGLNPNKAAGFDEISTKFKKKMIHPVTPALTRIFQASIDQDQTPEDWNSANVSSIFKKGDKSKPSNYHSVSLTSVCCRAHHL